MTSFEDTITIAPTMTGNGNRAWAVDVAAHNAREANKGGLAAWIVEAPRAHPLWHSFVISIMHLRPVEGLEPAFIGTLKDATHEIMVIALNPDEPRQPYIEGTGPMRILTPINFAGQFIASDDQAAIRRGEETVRLVVDGALNPDTDAIRQWIALFGDNMVKQP